MVILHPSRFGHSGFELLPSEMPEAQVRALVRNALGLLQVRGERHAAALLASVPFRLVEGTDNNGDSFGVLYAVLPLAEYERARVSGQDAEGVRSLARVVSVLGELGTYVRFVAVELAMEASGTAPLPHALKPLEVKRLVNNWIGVSGGYLGDFSYASHEEFYVDLNLPIDLRKYQGTTREKFMAVLGEGSPEVQARILEGVLLKYPVESSPPPNSKARRTPAVEAEIRGWISRLRGTAAVNSPNLVAVTSAVVERALSDAEELLRKNGPTSCVDRVHTALHGYLLGVCGAQGLPVEENASLTALLKVLREKHPVFAPAGPRSEDVTAIMRALSNIADKANPLRNNASVAHPNPDLLPSAEAMLIVNVVRSILHYLDTKLSADRPRLIGGGS